MDVGGNQQLTAYFPDHATAQDAAADLESAGISPSDIALHNQASGGGGFLDNIKRFFEGDSSGGTLAKGTLLIVTGSRAIAEPTLRRYDARFGSDTSAATDAGLDTERTMKLREERLTIDKQPVQAGEVRLGKEVVTQQQSIDVPVTHEEVFVSRRPVSEGASTADIGEIGDDQEIVVPVMREDVSVDKRAVVTEEVGLTKQTVQETQTVGATVRKERATLETDGDVTGQVNDVNR